jgi:hypothetical protein
MLNALVDASLFECAAAPATDRDRDRDRDRDADYESTNAGN